MRTKRLPGLGHPSGRYWPSSRSAFADRALWLGHQAIQKAIEARLNGQNELIIIIRVMDITQNNYWLQYRMLIEENTKRGSWLWTPYRGAAYNSEPLT